MNEEYNHLIHFAFLLLGLSYVLRDILRLRLVAMTASVLMILFNLVAYDRPIWVIIWWNLAFIGINTTHVLMILRERSRFRLSVMERAIRDAAFPGLEPHEFLKMIALAEIGSVEEGEFLVRQDETPADLVLLFRGHANVLRDGKLIASVGDATFLGEMAYLTGEVASASVVSSAPGVVVRWPVAPLRKLARKAPAVERSLQSSLTRDVIDKLRKPQVRQAEGAARLQTLENASS